MFNCSEGAKRSQIFFKLFKLLLPLLFVYYLHQNFHRPQYEHASTEDEAERDLPA